MFTQSIAELSQPSSTYTYSVIPMFSQYQQYLQNTSSSLLWNGQSIETKPQSLYYEFYENEIETYADPKSHIMKVKVGMNSNIYSSIDFNDIYYFEVNGNPQYYIGYETWGKGINLMAECVCHTYDLELVKII